MWWGLLWALAAAVAYGIASVLQAIAARSTADDSSGVRPRLLVRVLGQWRFLLGLGLDVLGFAAQLAALRVLPLFVVQSTLAASLAVTAIAALTLGVKLGRREWTAIAVVCAGLALLGASAASEGSDPVGTSFRLALIAVILLLGAAGILAGKASPRARTPALGLVAGLSFGVVAVSGRVLTDFTPLRLLADPAFYSLAAAGALAMLFYASALQRGSVTTATAMMIIGETVLPSLVGVIALGDRTKPGFAFVAIAGFALAVAAALALARFGEPTPVESTVSH
jgi:drug/metabolite transporter (DMT)-like permease